MKFKISLIALSLLTTGVVVSSPLFSSSFYLPSDISQRSKPATIRVKLAQNAQKLLLEAKGRYHIYDPDTEMLISSGIQTKRAWIVSDENGLKWKEVFPGIYQIRVVPADQDSSILINGIEYRGCVEIYDLKGKLLVVNEVDIERYLKSTMTAQFPNEMDDEVMDAVAIIARTNAYFLASRKAINEWDVEAKQVGYVGDALALQNRHVDRAIDHTQHMILTYEGTAFAATWVKDSAGTTADYATIFRKDLRSPPGVESPFSLKDKEKRKWTLTMTKAELARSLGLATIQALDLYKDQKSHKIYGVKIKDRDQAQSFDFFKLQNAVGSSRLKSNEFTVSLQGDQIIFQGYGEGASVGLCLFGANAMADKGDKAPQILSAFFPGTKLQNIRSMHTNN